MGMWTGLITITINLSVNICVSDLPVQKIWRSRLLDSRLISDCSVQSAITTPCRRGTSAPTGPLLHTKIMLCGCLDSPFDPSPPAPAHRRAAGAACCRA